MIRFIVDKLDEGMTRFVVVPEPPTIGENPQPVAQFLLNKDGLEAMRKALAAESAIVVEV